VVAGSGGSAVLPATDPLARAGAVASLARGAALAGSLPMTSGLALGAWWLALLLLLAGLALLVIARRWGTAQLH
jgi:hypothetical protein